MDKKLSNFLIHLYTLSINDELTENISKVINNIDVLNLKQDIAYLEGISKDTYQKYYSYSDDNKNLILILSQCLSNLLKYKNDDMLATNKDDITNIIQEINKSKQTIKQFLNSNLIGQNRIKEINKDNNLVQLINYISLNQKEIEEFVDVFNNNKNIPVDIEKTFMIAKEEIKKSTDEAISDIKRNSKIFNDELLVEKKNVSNRIEDVIQEKERLLAKVSKELEILDDNVQREQLARYFKRERLALKGDIDLRVIIFTLLCFLLELNYFSTENNSTTMYVLWFVGSFLFVQGIVNLISESTKSVSEDLNQDSNKNNQLIVSKLKNWLTKIVDICGNFVKQPIIISIFTPYWCWLFLTFVGMTAIFCLACCVVFECKVVADGITFNKLLPYTSLYLILIWFTWFCSKQFSYTKQICDEYEYKYALSKSYLGYRREVEELSQKTGGYTLMVALLDAVIKNIANSPIQNVRADKHMPFSEVVETVKGFVPNANNKE